MELLLPTQYLLDHEVPLADKCRAAAEATRIASEAESLAARVRGRLMLEMRCIGFTDAAIGRQLGITPQRVGRIIRKAFREAQDEWRQRTL